MEDEEKSDAAIAGSGEKNQHQQQQQQPLKINFSELFGSDQDEPPAEIVVVPSNRRRRRERKRAVESSQNEDDDDTSSSGAGELAYKSDHDLKSMIERISGNLKKLGSKLKDGGAKFRAQMHSCEAELERREALRRTQEVTNGGMKPVHTESSSNNGAFNGPKQVYPSSQSPKLSEFGSSLMKKLDADNPKPEHNTSNQTSKAFDKEISHLNRCDKRKRPMLFEKLPQNKIAKPSLYSKGFSAWKSDDQPPRKTGKFMNLNGKLAGIVSSTDSRPLPGKKLVGLTTDKDDSQALNSNGFEVEKTVVLVDEEEPEVFERKQETNELPSRLNEGKIYYPSREDPESLEIFRSELKCLEPGECLTSTIMNFYIRYLQEECSLSDTSRHNFYFFNTYFYSKLQEAVACQKDDKEAFFMKFRRWWKGVNIFQKAYILLPINEDNHWSLVIICFPDEEVESKLMMLHLDSLGLHSSSSIFKNIKSLLKNEWEILNEYYSAANVPIPERIWKNLPRRIDEETITVPRQTNDYDCGLFVLYYIERFIQEAPGRLGKKIAVDKSPMFGKNWFKPREASSLRGKIKKLLQDEFCKVLKGDNCTWEPVSLSSKAETTKAIDNCTWEPVSLSSKAETPEAIDQAENS